MLISLNSVIIKGYEIPKMQLIFILFENAAYFWVEKSIFCIIYSSYILSTISFFISFEHNNFVDKILYVSNSINVSVNFSLNIDFIFFINTDIKSTSVSSKL